MAYIKKLKDIDNNTVYPQTHTNAVYNAKGEQLQSWLNRYLTTEEVKGIDEIDVNFELTSNKVTLINADSTNAQYPSAKATYDLVTEKLSVLNVGINVQIVEALPPLGEANAQTIYFVPVVNVEEQNIYDEFLLINGAWEHLGTTHIDLTKYYTKEESNNIFAKKELYQDTSINLNTYEIGPYCVSVGEGTNANGGGLSGAVAEGYWTTASNQAAHAEGGYTQATGIWSHAEGYYSQATKDSAHAEGNTTTASGQYSHAEGSNTFATNNASHAEGQQTSAYGIGAHSEGIYTIANNDFTHAEGYSTLAMANYSHVEGQGTRADAQHSHVQGRYNVLDTNKEFLHIVGNGSAEELRSNAHTIKENGEAWFQGEVYVGSTNGVNKDSGSVKLAKTNEVLMLSTSSPVQAKNIWTGTEAQYKALSSRDAATIYITVG